MQPADFDRAIARIPAWILALAIAGTAVAGIWRGLPYAGGFLVGALCAYFNFRIIERAVNRISRLAHEPNESAEVAKADVAGGSEKKTPKTRRWTGPILLIQFGIFVLAAVVILGFSGFNLAAAFWGFLVCPAAAILEIIYELFRYGHS